VGNGKKREGGQTVGFTCLPLRKEKKREKAYTPLMKLARSKHHVSEEEKKHRGGPQKKRGRLFSVGFLGGGGEGGEDA